MRERTGKGQLIDSAMFDNMLSLNESMVALHSVAGQSPMRGIPKNIFPRGAFKTKDGYIALNVPDNIIWERLCNAINRIDMIEDPRCKTGVERAANAHYIQPIIEVWLEQLTRDDAVKKLNSSGVPTGPVNTAEDIFSDPHVNARGLLMPITDSEVGKHLFARSPPFLSEAPTLPTESAPKLGEHTIEILTEVLGYSGQKIKELSEGGVIGH
jgi:crotonobetainyl-CoA:carnitine CoA-transferase CaiB-like acyl-CoA transferase